ncbi:MAG: hypothetical protein LBK99_17320 [Opitutaceae bacterium]|nr:hypothetical protein [Opitutaceae bacterium]
MIWPGSDTKRVPESQRVRESGAGHVIFTLGQNSGHYCAPNEAYDERLREGRERGREGGGEESRLSRRDLVAEIGDALAASGVKLIAYLPSHAPARHPEAVSALRCTPPWDMSACGIRTFWPDSENADERLTGFQRNWEAVVACWGKRWGKRVAGWWIDGCYFADRIYNVNEEPNGLTFAAALRTGNPDRILAFNSGTAHPFARVIADQDYTAGEFSSGLPVASQYEPLGPVTADGLRTHLLGHLGPGWGFARGGEQSPRFTDELAQAYTGAVRQSGAALTWDVPILADGGIPEPFLRQFEQLGHLWRT